MLTVAAGATTIDVTYTPQVTLQTDDSLLFTLSAELASCGHPSHIPAKSK